MPGFVRRITKKGFERYQRSLSNHLDSKDWAAKADELAEHFLPFVNRADVYGTYRHSGKPFHMKRPLTKGVLLAHFRGEQPLGLHTTSTDNTCRFTAIDIDVHKEAPTEDDWAAARNAANCLAKQINHYGLTCLLEKSGRGYHVWIFFKEAIPSELAYRFARWLRQQLPKGIEADSFPRQPCVTKDKAYGNFVRLPGRHPTRDTWSRLYQLKEATPRLEFASSSIGLLLSTPTNDPSLLDKLEPKFPPVEVQTTTKPTAKTAKSLTPELRRWAIEELEEHSDDPNFDRSKRDFAVMYRLVKEGVIREEIASVVAGRSKFADDRDDYFDRTYDAALRVAGQSSGTNKAPSRPRTDLGNAERFVDHHADDVRYCAAFGWMEWDGKRWAPSRGLAAEKRASDTVRKIRSEATSSPDSSSLSSLAKHAEKSESRPRINALLEVAKPMLQVDADAFDVDPMLLNVRNGTINLKKGELQPHCRTDNLTKLTSIEYDPKAECPRFKHFLKRVFNDDKALIEYFQRVIGYTLTADVSEQCFFILYGDGNNGKTVLTTVMRALLGEYAVVAPKGLMVKRYNDEHPTAVTQLVGSRFAVSSEMGENTRLDEELIKWLTGGDTLTARRMRHDYFEFEPTHKLFAMTNHKPLIRGQDQGIWRRVHLIPFSVTIPARERNKNLAEELIGEELGGILAWAVSGCRRWRETGLAPPSTVVKATEEYRAEMSAVHRFIDEGCLVGDGLSVAATELYDAFCTFCKAKSLRTLTQTDFGTQLSSKGYDTKKSHGLIVRMGVALNS